MAPGRGHPCWSPGLSVFLTLFIQTNSTASAHAAVRSPGHTLPLQPCTSTLWWRAGTVGAAASSVWACMLLIIIIIANCCLLYTIVFIILSCLFLLPECLWWFLEVSGNPRPKRTSWDTYPESLLHPGGSFQLHRTAFQQRPDGQRGRYKVEQEKPRGRRRHQATEQAYAVLPFPLGLCCWTLKGRNFGSFMVAPLSHLKAKARSILAGTRAAFLEAALRLPAWPGWFCVTHSLPEVTCLCGWREFLPKRKKEPCSLHPQHIWKWCGSP